MLEWREVPPEEIEEADRNRCLARRGPRSKVQCEMDLRNHPDDWHTGRSPSGKWFSWEEGEGVRMNLRTKIAIFLGTLVTLVAASMVVATPAQASPNWSTCPSYDRVCLFSNINGGGTRVDIFNSTGVCINMSPSMNDAVSSIDNAWNDADLRLYAYFHSNCSGSSMYVGGNDAVNLNCCGREWINDNISSVKVRCVDFLNQCYRGP